MAEQEQGNIRQEYNNATAGLDLDQTSSQISKGKLTYALNAAVENFDASSVNYQNEQGNEFCVNFPEGYVLIGNHFINELNKHIFFITNPLTGGSQIGYMDNNDCKYQIYIDDSCLGFNINHPIHKVVHRITNCSTEIYWADNIARRYLDLNNVPYKLKPGSDLCDPVYSDEVDCNQLRIQPNFNVPKIDIVEAISGGLNKAGTYQFTIQYSDATGNPYTSYYSVTNPTPLADIQTVTQNFDYPVGKSIVVKISNLDVSGQFQYFNLAVIKTVNAISSVELVGTYFIDEDSQRIIYSGQSNTNIRLSIDDIFEKFPYYDGADDITTAQDILIWKGLTTVDRINYQQIASKIELQWESWRIPPDENYADEINATNLKGYLRDEVYPIEFVPILASGKQVDGFHIPGRRKNFNENLRADVPETNPDFVGAPSYYQGGVGFSPFWKIYNTATVKGMSPSYSTKDDYKGVYQYGEFAYWESSEEYPCNVDVWGELAGQKIRHHKFPDVQVSPIYESKSFTNQHSMVMGNVAIFPIGIKVDPQQIRSLIDSSNLTNAQKSDIVGFKIVRGDRSTNKSVVAKGILRNVGSYERDGNKYIYPNYPYNDRREDSFINSTNNAYSEECTPFRIEVTKLQGDTSGGSDYAEVEYLDCNTNKIVTKIYETVESEVICSIDRPRLKHGSIIISSANYDIYEAKSEGICTGYRVEWDDKTDGIKSTWIGGYLSGNRSKILECRLGSIPRCIELEGEGDCNNCGMTITYLQTVTTADKCASASPLSAITDEPYVQIFNSPETSFGQPFLGNVLKLESVIFGRGKAHFTEVKKNAKYKFLTEEIQRDALNSSALLGGLTNPFNVSAMFAAYQAYLTIFVNSITRKNYAYSFNSIADYNYSEPVSNEQGIKQRNLDISRYLIPSVVAIEGNNVNNYQRESSVYLTTDALKPALPFPDESPNMMLGINRKVVEKSRFTISETGNCGSPGRNENIDVVSYYASLKNEFVNQWGQVYSYETIDTGFQYFFNLPSSTTVFGGDTFISRFAFKTKLPFFIDNKVGAPDDSDIFYDEIGNIGYPKYWHSARSIFKNYEIPTTAAVGSPGTLTNIISYKAHNFDCTNDRDLPKIALSTTTTTTTFVGSFWLSLPSSSYVRDSKTLTEYRGYFYLFAYGVPNFYCETSYNTDLRQAFNNKEGDFWPHVSSNIPDDWVQESFVSIANDNTYYYNTTFSKQNKENKFTHLPPDWIEAMCYTNYPFRAIYSDVQNTDADVKVNSWRTYRALSYFDFPQNYGKLISLDGIQNRGILARFENKTLLYNSLITIDTSNPQSAYVGNPNLFKNPPIDFSETDLGYVGTQNKMLLKIPQGQVSLDAKRGQVFLITGQNAVDISAFGSGMNRFFTDHLAFEILRFFPNANTDNHFNGIGLHGVFDSKYERIILTKLDYVPIDPRIKYDELTQEFYIEEIITPRIYDCSLEGYVIYIDTCKLEGFASLVGI